MKVRMVKKIEHYYVPGLTKHQKRQLQAGGAVQVTADTAQFLLKQNYVVEVKEPKPTKQKQAEPAHEDELADNSHLDMR